MLTMRLSDTETFAIATALRMASSRGSLRGKDLTAVQRVTDRCLTHCEWVRRNAAKSKASGPDLSKFSTEDLVKALCTRIGK